MMDAPTVGMIAKASVEARRLRQNWLGPEHFLLAVVSQSGTAAAVFGQLGLTYETLASRFGSTVASNGRRQPYRDSKGITMNPAAHDVSGWARGFGAASGRSEPIPEDWLLAILYQDHGVVGAVLHEFGVSPIDVIHTARRMGVTTPDYEPENYRPWNDHREVEVDESDWQGIVDILGTRYPPGSQLRWGFNSRNDRPGKVQFSAEEGIDLDAILDELKIQRR